MGESLSFCKRGRDEWTAPRNVFMTTDSVRPSDAWAARNDARVMNVPTASGEVDHDRNLLHPLRDRSVPAQCLRTVCQGLGAHNPALWRQPDRVFPATRGDELRGL